MPQAALDALIPVLYLRGISTGDFQEALAALLGEDAPNLSSDAVRRLKDGWQTGRSSRQQAAAGSTGNDKDPAGAMPCRHGSERNAMQTEERIYRALMNLKYGRQIYHALLQTVQYGPDSRYAEDLLLIDFGRMLAKIMMKGAEQLKDNDPAPMRPRPHRR